MTQLSEWYTPEHVLATVEEFLGAIDLDPCSNQGLPNVPAARHFTRDDDGLTREWHGRVYMNPPYGDEIGLWVRKLQAAYDSGLVPEAIALVPAKVHTQWWDVLSRNCICFIQRGRLTFTGGKAQPAPFPSALVYLGERRADFTAHFSALGGIYERLD